MKIVHIITRFLNGGADENTLYSCNWSAAKGDEVYLLFGSSADREILERLDPRVKTVVIPTMASVVSPVRDAQALLEIIKVLRDVRPDLVHTHTSKAGILGRAAARIAGVKGIVHGVHIAPFLNVGRVDRLIYLYAERLAARWTHAFISVSRGMRDAFLDERIGPPERHHVIHSGMNLDDFRKPNPIENWRELLGCGPEEAKPPVVLMLAAFEKRKRHIELIKTFDRVLEVMPNVRLLLGGDGIERPAIEAAVAASRNPSRIRLAGFNPNPGGLIDLADVCLHCSTREGLPRVVVQYIAAGVPVVMTRLPGIDEIVIDGTNGFVVGEEDFSGLGKALVKLLEDKALLQSMTQAASAYDVSAWGVDKMCQDNQVVYDAVLARA